LPHGVELHAGFTRKEETMEGHEWQARRIVSEPSTLSPTQPGSITQSTRPIQPTALNTSPQQKKPSPFKNRPPWAPGAIKNDEAHGATLSTSVRSGERKCSDHDDSSDDSSDDELPSLSKIFGARPPQVTGPTGDSSDEVCNLPWPDRHWLHWLTLTHLGLAGIVPTSSVNAASSRLSTTANPRLVGHPGRVKWTKHTGFPDVEIAF
jgi:hypothetical protein